MRHFLKQKNINADKMKIHIRRINSAATTFGMIQGPILGAVLYDALSYSTAILIIFCEACLILMIKLFAVLIYKDKEGELILYNEVIPE